MLKKICCNEKNKGWALLLLRLALGITFMMMGWAKLNGMEAHIQGFEAMGFPMAAFFAYLNAGLEFIGGIALIVGLLARFFGLFLFLMMLVALLAVHLKGPLDQASMAMLMGSGSFVIASFGAGNLRLFKDKAECMCPNSKK